ncbi:MlaD family protein [Treponema pectinovorum]|uniref:MlaD family protein n=1 Tax=Treponema pectinovorum TaxID=164 RepID=UPI0011F2974C|nr:MlaD family protein [Treponema pectinovorum]
MKFKIRFADQIVGIFSIIALAGLIALIFAIGGRQHWFEKKLNFYTVFESGSGLSVGMDLNYKGFSIGKIKKVSLEGVMVRVDYYVLGEYSSFIKENSLVQLVTSPIGLGSSFNFYPGSSYNLLEDGSEIFRVDSVPGQLIVEENLNQIEKQTDSIGALMNQVSTLLVNVNSLVSQIDSAFAGKLRTKVTPIQSIVKETDSLIKNINSILQAENGSLSQILGADLYKNLNSVVANLFKISSDFASVSQNTDKLLENVTPQVDEALVQLNTVLLQLQDVMTGVKNNPLLRGGIPDRTKEEPSTFQMRNFDF